MATSACVFVFSVSRLSHTHFHSEASDLAEGAVKVVALDAGDGGPGPVEGDMVRAKRRERGEIMVCEGERECEKESVFNIKEIKSGERTQTIIYYDYILNNKVVVYLWRQQLLPYPQ